MAQRAELDVKRAAAVQRYLATVPSFVPGTYEIFVHNPATPGINAEMSLRAYNNSVQSYTGTRTGGVGSGSLGTGGGGTTLTVTPSPAGSR